MEFNTNFEKMSFDDVSIKYVSRVDSQVTKVLCGMFISKQHPRTNGSDLIVQNGGDDFIPRV